MRLPMDALAEAKAIVSQARTPIAVVSSSEGGGEWVGVAQRSYHACGQQLPENHCNALEHISLDELVDQAGVETTRGAAEGAAAAPRTGAQPGRASAEERRRPALSCRTQEIADIPGGRAASRVHPLTADALVAC